MYEVEQKCTCTCSPQVVSSTLPLFTDGSNARPLTAHTARPKPSNSRTSEALARPSRLSKHDDLITPNTVAVASEACALVATTNINISYRAPLRLLLRDE